MSEKPCTAQRELRGVALDRLTFPTTLTLGQDNGPHQPLRSGRSMNEVGCDLGSLCSGVREPGDGAMIAVQIARGWTDDQRRTERVHDHAQLIAEMHVAAARKRRDLLIGKGEES